MPCPASINTQGAKMRPNSGPSVRRGDCAVISLCAAALAPGQSETKTPSLTTRRLADGPKGSAAFADKPSCRCLCPFPLRYVPSFLSAVRCQQGKTFD